MILTSRDDHLVGRGNGDFPAVQIEQASARRDKEDLLLVWIYVKGRYHDAVVSWIWPGLTGRECERDRSLIGRETGVVLK